MNLPKMAINTFTIPYERLVGFLKSLHVNTCLNIFEHVTASWIFLLSKSLASATSTVDIDPDSNSLEYLYLKWKIELKCSQNYYI